MTNYWTTKEKEVLKTILPLREIEDREGLSTNPSKEHQRLALEFLNKFEALGSYKNKQKFAKKYVEFENQKGAKA